MAIWSSNNERRARAVALVAINSVQVSLTWWIIRDAATTSPRRQSLRASVFRVLVLIAANAIQIGLTWRIYRTRLRSDSA
jgi:hypothetical protein